MAKSKLHTVKDVADFEKRYWYAIELKQFARDIGVANSSKLRKVELEEIIKTYLQSGKLPNIKVSSIVRKDNGDKLALTEMVRNYISNKDTKSFIMTEAQKLVPDLPKKSGVWYWTNRWREEQLEKKRAITYLDLIKYFVELSVQEGRLPQIPSAQFNNFITDFIAAEAGNREDAIAAWEAVKKLNIPKNYAAWLKYHS